MTDLTTLLDRNERLAENFEAGDLKMRPQLSTILLTCVDARVDPAHIFGLAPGEAVVIRNAGGRITSAVLRDLSILSVLGANMPGPSAMQPQLVIMHHTDCGMARLAKPPVQQQVAQRLGLTDDEVTALAVTDPVATVRADIEGLRETPAVPDQLVVTGLVYDVKVGTVGQVVAAAPLRVAG